MQVESLRQRLSQLKKASIELKSKVLQESHIDLLSVSQILTGVLPASHLQVYLPLSQTNTLLDIPLRHGYKSPSSQSLTYSPNSSIFMPTISQHAPVPPSSLAIQRNQDLILWNSNTSSHESSPSREAIEIEIEKLRAQNEEIQGKILNLSSDISDLRAVQALREEESWKEHLPFINKEGPAGIFLTKLHVKDYDFDKIDYERGHCELFFDRLSLHLLHRPQRTLKMGTVSEVKYLGDRRMRLEFKEDEITYCYIQLGSQAERQEWDLAFITNHRIVTDKDLNRHLFLEEKELGISKARSKSSLKVGEFDPQGKSVDKDINKRKGSVRFNDRKFEKYNSNQKQSHSSSFRRSELSAQRSQLDYTLNGISPETPEGLINNSSAVSADSNKEKSLKDFMVFGEVGESHQESRANTSKFNAPEVNFENLEFYPTFTQEAPIAQAEEESRAAIERQRALVDLKQGYFFTKYAKNGFKPHNKKIFVSSEEEMLICANSEDLKERRAIRIQNITAIKYPAIGQGIRKYLKSAKTENYCVIQYQNQEKDQVIQLGCNNVTFIKRFSEQLGQFLRKKGVLIND